MSRSPSKGADEPWLLVVPDADDADLLRRIGRKTIALTEPNRLHTELPVGLGSEVLCVGLAQNIAGDLRNAGVETVWGIHVPVGHLSIRHYLEHVAEQNGLTVINEELAEFLLALEEGARDIGDAKPTGHPDLPGADPNAPPTRRSLNARLRDRSKILDIAVTRWLICNYATCGSVIFVAADPNLGKSTVANAWGHCIWTGHAWLGHAVLPGSVLFILGEDIRGASLRARAWEASYGPCTNTEGRYIEYADRMPPLCEEAGQLELRRLLLCLRAEHGHAPAMVVIDTLSTVWGSESENAAEMAAGLMAVLASLADEFSSTFVLIHHLNKAPANQGKPREITLSSIRGASAFVGGADDVLVLEDTGDGSTKFHGIKARNTDKAPAKFLRVQRVSLGANQDGDDVSSVIMVEAPAETPRDAAEVEQAQGDQAWTDGEVMVTRAIEALRKLGSARSRTAIANRMPGKRSAKFAGIDDAMTRELITDAGTARAHRFVVAADQECVSRKTPHTPEAGTGNRFPADAGPDSVPRDTGTGSPRTGTGNRKPSVNEDDGLPEQPKRRRKAKAGDA